MPKFASFRPKAQASEVEDEREKDDGRLESLPTGRKHFQDSKISRHYGRNDDLPTHSRHVNRQSTKSDTQLAAPRSDHQPRDYILDTRGDEDNVRYGSLHRFSVPPYRRIGYGNVLGLSLKQKIDRAMSSDKRIIIPPRDIDSASRRDRNVLAKVRKQKELRIRPSSILPAPNSQADFLSFNVAGARHGLDDYENPSLSDEEDYRSIYGRTKPSPYLQDEDLEYGSDEVADEAGSLLKETRLRGAELSRLVEQDPSNGSAWLELVAHQECLYGGRAKLTNAESQSLADIRLSILEKALKQVKDDRYVEQLLCSLMDQAALLWDATRKVKKWEEVLSQHPTYITLWTKYLDFLQTDFATFRMEDLREAFAKALQKVRIVKESRGEAFTEYAHIQCYLLLRVTCCMKDAGFSEQAFGVWQANLEFNTRELDKNEDLIAKFETYWESEVRRIGEEDSRSWADFLQNGGGPPGPMTDSVVSGLQDCASEDWYSSERDAEENLFPARTADNTMEDDTYRVILFSDVEPFLININGTSWNSLVQAFLAFNSLPSLPTSDIVDSSWWWDPFVRNDHLRGNETTTGLHAATIDSNRTFQASMPRSIFTADSAFAGSISQISVFPAMTDIGKRQLTFVRHALSSLVARVNNDYLSVYFLGFENTYFPSSARKAAKRLLKQQPSCLKLYNAYALIEFSQSNRATAEKVLLTAINMSRDDPQTSLLWQTWIFELLERASAEVALSRLMTMPDSEIKEQAPRPGSSESADFTRTVRVHRLLTSCRDQCISIGNVFLAVHYSTLHLLLAYLSSEDALSTAVTAFNSSLAMLPGPPHSLFHEILHQSLARIISYHVAHHPSFSPRIVRSALQRSVSLFPQNTLFLSMFASVESRFRIDDRIRSTVSSIVHGSEFGNTKSNDNPQAKETVLTHMFAIYIELSRSTEMGSNQHSVRATFERAVQSECGGKNALIWQSYILWELQQGGHAKAVWWRAIRGCPWVKRLWIMPWQYQGLVRIEELKGIYELMMDKEIRIRIQIEE